MNTIGYYQDRLFGMTPRQLESVLSINSIRKSQIAINYFPTLNLGRFCVFDLMDRMITDDCEVLFEFLQLGLEKRLLGRLLIDLSRLSDRMIFVDVEVDRSQYSSSFSLEKKYVHTIHIDNEDRNSNYVTRTFVLTKQNSEADLWAVLAKLAAKIHATHCTYVGEELLLATGGIFSSYRKFR